ALGLPVLGTLFLWCYWPTFASMVRVWSGDPQYSHGFLVPAFALYLLWLRRQMSSSGSRQTSDSDRTEVWRLPLRDIWLGLALLAVAGGLRLAGARFHLEYLDQVSLLPCVAGLFMLAG